MRAHVLCTPASAAAASAKWRDGAPPTRRQVVARELQGRRDGVAAEVACYASREARPRRWRVSGAAPGTGGVAAATASLPPPLVASGCDNGKCRSRSYPACAAVSCTSAAPPRGWWVREAEEVEEAEEEAAEEQQAPPLEAVKADEAEEAVARPDAAARA